MAIQEPITTVPKSGKLCHDSQTMMAIKLPSFPRPKAKSLRLKLRPDPIPLNMKVPRCGFVKGVKAARGCPVRLLACRISMFCSLVVRSPIEYRCKLARHVQVLRIFGCLRVHNATHQASTCLTNRGYYVCRLPQNARRCYD